MDEFEYPYYDKEENLNTSIELEVNIDFDLAKSEWRKNKKPIREGMFEYTCQYIHSSGKKCNKSVYTKKTSKYVVDFGGLTKDNNIIINNKKACEQHMNRYIRAK